MSLLAGCSTLPRFERTLASQPSATAALEQWCAARRIADPPVIRAQPVPPARALLPSDLTERLDTGPDTPITLRHVRLSCGGTVLSEAYNWYVPARLTPAMNTALAETDTPFGKVIAPLGFSRELLAAERGAVPPCPPGTVLSHRALLRLPDGKPLALLLECYTAANLR